MSLVVFLDAGPLGLVTNPARTNPDAVACAEWLIACLKAGVRVCVPEISDYEVRRELIRAAKTKGLERLDALKAKVDYVPITTEAMLEAARFWAEARNRGSPTAAPEALDADVILAAQATISAESDDELVIATTNVGHLGMFVTAKRWNDIEPG